MSEDAPAADPSVPRRAVGQQTLDYPPVPSQQHIGQTLGYFGLLTLFIYLATPAGWLVDIQTSYMLKNQLHATARTVSIFRLVTGVPVYLAFLAGLVRDQWSPLGLRDRGYFLLFAPIMALNFVLLAVLPLSSSGLLIGMLAVMLLSRFLMAAYQGLMALVGQNRLVSGRLAVVWNVVATVPLIAGALASGYISDHFRPTATFLLVAAFTLCVGVFGFWAPRSVFGDAYDGPQARAAASFVADVRRLVRHWPIYPAIFIWFLWAFAPGANTPLQFYLTNKLHASDSVYSYYGGIYTAGFIPTFLLYGFLCKRVTLRKLLWWGTIAGIPQMIPLAMIHSADLALILAIPIGLMGGVATAAYYDLAMRSCPPGLQGTLMMLVDGMLVLSARGGDLLGSGIYNSSPAHGFLYCVIATTAVYALILPLIWLIPAQLIATADGEPNPAVQGELVEESAELGAAVGKV